MLEVGTKCKVWGNLQVRNIGEQGASSMLPDFQAASQGTAMMERVTFTNWLSELAEA